MPDPSGYANAAHRQPKTHLAAWLCLLAALGGGIALQNPAVALLGGLLIRLGLDVNPVRRGMRLGAISLQTAVVLLGLTLGFDRMVSVSADYGVTVAAYVLTTLLLGWAFARLIRSDRVETSLLTSGTAICGATAIATLAPVVGARPHQLAAATGIVFLLNAVALFTFPAIGGWLELSQETFGAWVALAIHDTSSVVATAAIYGDEAAAVATTVKLGRALWLIPLAFAASLLFARCEAKLRVPPFILLFVAAAAVGGAVEFGEQITQGIGFVSKTLLVIALGLIGLELDRASLGKLSLSSLVLGVGLWLAVVPLALMLVLFR
ncbi:MAG: putative sulfate exporter family transporter [Gammaproteobacteria bacterium]|nr:putative sulfate exporter family transporter [Gammaproteobacteria bacterium]